MKILITGAGGQLGRELKRSLATLGEVIALTRQQLDLANTNQLIASIRQHAPTHILNAAAWTAVDKAETETDAAHAVNGHAPGVLAEEATRLDAVLVHYSTDYVFDGFGTTPWKESDTPNPQSVYGRSKLAGEQAIAAVGGRCLVLRTSWVFGLHGANFMNTMLRLAKDRNELRVIGDQYGTPTWTRHLADATALALLHPGPATGLYHLAAAGETTWHAYAEAIFEEATRLGLLNKTPTVHRITTADYPLPAPRPANSRLDCSLFTRDFGLALPDWRIGLNDCLADRIL
jgi:dTDP-4-dehydrorhamnose reductase